MIATAADRAQFVLRVADLSEGGDRPLIRDSWKRSYESGGRHPKCEGLIYWEGQSQLVDRLLAKTRVVVAVNPEDSSQVFGWVCFERAGRVAIVHYLFVKSPFRRCGVGRALADAAIGDAPGLMHSHRTPDGDRWAKRLKSTWNPYLTGVLG